MIVKEPLQVIDSCRALIQGVVDQYKAVFYTLGLLLLAT